MSVRGKGAVGSFVGAMRNRRRLCHFLWMVFVWVSLQEEVESLALTIRSSRSMMAPTALKGKVSCWSARKSSPRCWSVQNISFSQHHQHHHQRQYPLFMTAAASFPSSDDEHSHPGVPNPITDEDSQQQQQQQQKDEASARVNGEGHSSVIVVNKGDIGGKEAALPFWKVLWKFTRPHTIIGSAMAIPALHWFAAPSLRAALQPAVWRSMLFAMVPSLLMNLYITGLNQITDVDIDKVNKPYLPIAAGQLSLPRATCIVCLSLLASLTWGMAHPILGTHGLNVALWGSMILGTLYSLPPFRLKRFPLLAAFCVVSVRGAIINAGFFAHAKAAAFSTTTAPTITLWTCLFTDSRCFLSSLFFAVFGVVIALMKDVPDYTGDAQFNIRSFTVRAGPHTIFHAMKRLLSLAFVTTGAIFAKSAIFPIINNNYNFNNLICRILVSASAMAAGISVHKQAINVNPEDSTQVYNYYMHLWKLFYLSYIVLPFVR